jgi:hypothetical protein
MFPSTSRRPDLNSTPGNSRAPRLLEGIALLLIAVSAILFQRSATASWAEARVADGRRLQVSPIGLVDFGLGTSGTPATECRWWPKLGDEALCSVSDNGEPSMARLRRAYPLVVVAMWMSVLALFLNALRIPRSAPAIGIVVTMVVPVVGIVALWSVASSANAALAVLAGAEVRVAPAGFASVFAAALCMAVACGLLVASGAWRAAHRKKPSNTEFTEFTESTGQ